LHYFSDLCDKKEEYGCFFLATIYEEKKNYKEAEKHQSLALNLTSEINAQNLLKEVYKALSETYYAQKRVEEAYQARLLYDQTKDLLYNEESSMKLAKIEIAFDLQQHEKEIEISQKEVAISQLEDQNNKSYILVLVMSSMLLFAALFIFISLKKRKT
jgi:hypothetical protein